MSFEKLEELMTPEDFQEYEKLYAMKEDVYSPQWHTIQDMMQKILAKYGLDTPEDPYGIKDDEEDL